MLGSSASAATFTVLNTHSAGADIIAFAITDAALTIVPTNALPVITDAVILDATTQPGFSNAPIVELNGVSAGAAADGLSVAAGNCIVRGLVINRFLGDGIQLSGGGNNVAEGCIIGLNAAGTSDQGNTLNGIFITNLANNLIGGTNASSRNYILGNNQNGVSLVGVGATNNCILGNIIGLDRNGADRGNSQDGILLNGVTFNTIAGRTRRPAMSFLTTTATGWKSAAPTLTSLQPFSKVMPSHA